MKTKQGVLNAMLIVITMVLLCWNIKQHQDINTLRAEDTSLKGSISGVATVAKAVQNTDTQRTYRMTKIEDRLKDTEAWIYNFEDIMFGAPEETSAE